LAPLVFGTIRVHRTPPYVRDDRETPLVEGRDGRVVSLIWGEHEAEFFRKQNWTEQIALIRHDKSGCRRASMPPLRRRALRARRTMSAIPAKAKLALRRLDFGFDDPERTYAVSIDNLGGAFTRWL
jgi:hypothetical protein